MKHGHAVAPNIFPERHLWRIDRCHERQMALDCPRAGRAKLLEVVRQLVLYRLSINQPPSRARMNVPISVLLVEDSASDADLIVRQLQRAGFEVSHRRVESAAEMSAALREQRWDAVLSDFRLPGFGAGKALALLQESGLDLPFIIVSGVIEEEVAIELMRRGAHDCIMKSGLSRLGPAVTRELADARVRMERRHTEVALRESEERFRSMADSATDAIVAVDEDGRIVFFSRGAEAVFGHAPGEAVGKPVTLLIPPEHHAAHLAGVRRYLETGRSTMIGQVIERSGIRKDGSAFPLELALSASTVAGRAQFTAIIRDITARKEMEAELIRRVSENERARAALLGVLEDQHETEIQIRRMNTAYATLSQTNEAIVRIDTRDVLFERICHICVETGGYIGAWIGLIDEETRTLVLEKSAGRVDDYIHGLQVSLDPSLAGGARADSDRPARGTSLFLPGFHRRSGHGTLARPGAAIRHPRFGRAPAHAPQPGCRSAQPVCRANQHLRCAGLRPAQGDGQRYLLRHREL